VTCMANLLKQIKVTKGGAAQPVKGSGGSGGVPSIKVVKEKMPLAKAKKGEVKGNAPDAGSEDQSSKLLAQVHEAMNRGDTAVSNAGFGVSVANEALKNSSGRLGAASAGLGKLNLALSAGRAAVDSGRLLRDKDYYEKTLNEAASGEMSPLEFALGAIDLGQAPTTYVQAGGVVTGGMDARRDAEEQLSMNDDQDEFRRLLLKRKANSPLTYGAGPQEVPVVDPNRLKEEEAARKAFEDRVLEEDTMGMVREVLRSNSL